MLILEVIKMDFEIPQIQPQSVPNKISDVSNDKVTKKVMATEMYNTIYGKRVATIIGVVGIVLMAIVAAWIKMAIALVTVAILGYFMVKDTQFMTYLEKTYKLDPIRFGKFFARKK